MEERNTAVDRQFFDSVTAWASTQPAIVAILTVGSHARGTAGTDSDIDLIVVTSEHALFLADLSWLSTFGNPRTIDHEDYGLVQSIRVAYDHGLEVEFGIAKAGWLDAVVTDQSTRRVVVGALILYDPQHKAAEALAQAR
jgi:predicted nucleotidyltransferase